MKQSRFLILMTVVMLITACSGDQNTAEPINNTTDSAVTFSLGDAAALPTPSHPGEANYYTLCAHCHGYDGEGQIATTLENTRSLGMKTVPPHNAEGHTWEHATPLLVEVIQNGINNPLNHYPMAGFGAVLNEQEILDLIDFMRGWWTEDQQDYQAEVTDHFIEMNGD